MSNEKENLLSAFDEEQRKAITTIDGPVLCIAGPGAGKTTVIVNRTAEIVRRGADPASILVLSFTNTDAANARNRYSLLPGSVEGPVFSTIHAFAYMVVRENTSYPLKVLSGGEQESRVRLIIRQMNEKQRELERKYNAKHHKSMWTSDTQAILGDISRKKMAAEGEIIELQGFENAEDFDEFFRRYEQENEVMHQIDFDDMLVLCDKLLQNPAICKKYHERYKYIMIDEFQDTNFVQAHILYTLAAPENNLFVCGDEDQSIYGFRDAKPQLMLNFPKRFPNAKVIYLTRNYRSKKSIVQSSANLISHNKDRFDKDLVAQSDEEGTVVFKEADPFEKDEFAVIKEKIRDLEREGNSLSDIAILCRTNKEVAFIAQYLTQEGINVLTDDGGASIHSSMIYKVMAGYLRIAYNRETAEDVRTCINRPFRYISAEVLDECHNSLPQLLNYAMHTNNHLRAHNIYEFLSLVSEIRTIARSTGFKAAVPVIMRLVGLQEWVENDCNENARNNEEQVGIMGELIKEACKFDSLESYEFFANYMDQKVKDTMRKIVSLGLPAVTCKTLHSSKGKEWRFVIIPSCNDGNIPYHRRNEPVEDMEEERRLMYVGITRAKDSCTLISNGYDPLSNFISEKDHESKKKTIKKITIDIDRKLESYNRKPIPEKKPESKPVPEKKKETRKIPVYVRPEDIKDLSFLHNPFAYHEDPKEDDHSIYFENPFAPVPGAVEIEDKTFDVGAPTFGNDKKNIEKQLSEIDAKKDPADIPEDNAKDPKKKLTRKAKKARKRKVV